MHQTLKKFGRVAGLLASSVVIACDGSGLLTPPAGLAHSVATPSCGAADGATLALYLKRSPIESLPIFEPYLQVSVSGSIGSAEGRSWRIPEQHDNWAAFRASPSNHEVATSGGVTITSVGADSSVEGNLTLGFPSGRIIRGGFQARWITRPTNFFCG